MAKQKSAAVDTAWSERERDHYHEIQNLARLVLKSRTEYVTSKEEANLLRKRYEKEAEALETLINQGPNPQQPLPFDGEDEV